MRRNTKEPFDGIGSQSVTRSRNLIRASEVGEYVYCRRSWFLGAQGVNSGLEQIEKKHAGIEYHKRHGKQVNSARKLRSVGIYVLLLLLVLALTYRLYVHFQ